MKYTTRLSISFPKLSLIHLLCSLIEVGKEMKELKVQILIEKMEIDIIKFNYN